MTRFLRLPEFLALALFVLVAILAGATLGTVVAQTPEPTARLNYTKTANAPAVGEAIIFTIAVTNSGTADSDSQSMQDTLPAGFDWDIISDSWGCSLSPSTIPGRLLLSCAPTIVEKRHLNDAEDDFVNGIAQVRVAATAETCGSVGNIARFLPENVTRSATATIACPTPTATPTSASTPTSTPAPNTPTATAPPATATPFVVTATPTPPRFVPGPPNTGDSPMAPKEASYELVAIGLIVMGFSMAAAFAWPLWMRRIRSRE